MYFPSAGSRQIQRSVESEVSVLDKSLQLSFFSQDRGNNNSVMSNYEAYKPSTGAMGDRLTAMKAAFQVGLITRTPRSDSRGKDITWKS